MTKINRNPKTGRAVIERIAYAPTYRGTVEAKVSVSLEDLEAAQCGYNEDYIGGRQWWDAILSSKSLRIIRKPRVVIL